MCIGRVVLRTYGIPESLKYSPRSMVEQGFTGVQMSQLRLFTDAWVVDLRDMAVVAHHRFSDDPLPDIMGEDYYKSQRKKGREAIRLWLEENAR